MLTSTRLTLGREIRRFMHVRSVPHEVSSTSLTPNGCNGESQLHVERLPSIKTSDSISLNAVGNPPTMVSVTIPPSLSVFVKRNALLMIQGSARHINSRLRLLNPIKTALLEGRVQTYEELVSAEPTSLLVSSSVNSRSMISFKCLSPKSIAPLELTGSNDWAVLQKDALQIYGGPSLVVAKHKVPKLISRGFAKRLGQVKRGRTGLASLATRGFTFIGGRGVAALAGSGSVFVITVRENEDVLINKNNLLALSVNGPHDLQNCVVEAQVPGETDNKNPVPREPLRAIHSLDDFLKSFSIVVTRVYEAWYWFSSTVKLYLWGRNNFIRIVGPRTVLLQSEAPRAHFVFGSGNNIASEKFLETTREKSPSDFLHVVSCAQDKPSIKSTSSFVTAPKGTTQT
ncbi:hypothetical protein FT663_03398 [Candidozyma haemuli var. vulneris]|nr:hypothetical protein FT662_04044 [[Candida] haemuloni var. vulneris]KAF3989921.1 hypothetical protein FT663_03398 [[Candida] haemuloni var. vulneris]